jgi:CRP-like cAMP-binding protein
MTEIAEPMSIDNRLLAALPREEYDRLLPSMKPVHLPKGKIVYDTGEHMHYAYFINDGMVSLLSTTESGASLEIAMVGNEGLIGIPLILKRNKTPYQVMIQIVVQRAMRIRAQVLIDEFNQGGKLQDLLLIYTHLLLSQTSQSAVCHRFHNIEKRLARWLLVARDRVRSDTFVLTQELISHMLGSPRTHVTKTAGVLQKEGLIHYSRGKITIMDRQGLEASACECYRILKDEFEHFLDVEDSTRFPRH